MALTRKFLESFGLTDGDVDAIIAAHAQTVDALKEQRDAARAQAEQGAADAARAQAEGTERMQALQAEFDTYQASIEGGPTGPTSSEDSPSGLPQERSLQRRYEALQAEFDEYRQRVEGERLRQRKASALRGALREAGVLREDLAELLLKAADLDAVNPDDPAAAVDELRHAYGGCFAEVRTEGVPVVAPPSGSPRITADAVRGMSEREINANWAAVKEALGAR